MPDAAADEPPVDEPAIAEPAMPAPPVDDPPTPAPPVPDPPVPDVPPTPPLADMPALDVPPIAFAPVPAEPPTAGGSPSSLVQASHIGIPSATTSGRTRRTTRASVLSSTFDPDDDVDMGLLDSSLRAMRRARVET
jgi:hypothetical protein